MNSCSDVGGVNKADRVDSTDNLDIWFSGSASNECHEFKYDFAGLQSYTLVHHRSPVTMHVPDTIGALRVVSTPRTQADA
jgi:hypothetical protein